LSCCVPAQYETVFSEKRAKKDLERYRKKGPDKTTRLLLEALKKSGGAQGTVLDIGAGIGVEHHELLAAGAQSAVHVEATAPSLRAARDESTRRGHADRVRFLQGDFVALAKDIEAADVVILNRVICCYPDMKELVMQSAAKTRRFYAASFPRETLLPKLGVACANLFFRIQRNAFRTYLHSPAEIDALLRRAGLELRSLHDMLMWRVVVYERKQN
jgi:magnesium-protoporphyrin O-methyltransferase